MRRVLPGIAMAVLWVAVILAAPQWLFRLLIFVLGIVGLHEYYRMTRPADTGLLRQMLVGAALLPLAAALHGTLDALAAGIFAGLLVSIFIIVKFYTKLENVLGLLALNSFGALYISFCLAHLVLIRALDQGSYWLLLLSAVTACSDTGAYCAGRAFGRRKLCPNISPGKTVAGAVGGVAAGVAGALLVGHFFLPRVSLGAICIMGLILALLGIVGDLTESIIKRSSGVKDSGKILSGHGGLLDRVDSLLLTGPTLFFFLWFNVIA